MLTSIKESLFMIKVAVENCIDWDDLSMTIKSSFCDVILRDGQFISYTASDIPKLYQRHWSVRVGMPAHRCTVGRRRYRTHA